jgi:hypothetical protein
MEISLFQPYPDLKRIWARAWLTAVPDQKPNIEIAVLNPDSTENTSVYLMAHPEQRLETTLHLRNPQAGATYHVVATLSLGLTDQPELIERQEFDLILEFRNPQKHEPGFGIGVDWAQLQTQAQTE